MRVHWHLWRDYRAWAFVLVTAGLVTSCVAIRYALRDSVTEERKTMETLKASWTDASGILREVETTRKATGETEAQFEDRHEARVNAHLEKYPKAVPPE